MTGLGGQVVGVVLAGGLARRMGGGDKGLIELGGKPLLSHVIERLSRQAGTCILNANGDPRRFQQYGLTVVPDPIEGAAGPLAGVLAGLEWTRANAPHCPWIATAAVDSPFFPENLVSRLMDVCGKQGADMACAVSGGRAHPVFGLWPVRLADELRHALIEEGVRKVDIWTQRFSCAEARFDAQPIDPFFNVNKPEDVEQARALLDGVAS